MVERASLIQVQWDSKKSVFEKVDGAHVLNVQFNPESLRVTYTNENRGSGQPSGSGGQNVGQFKSKMNAELFFDTTETGADVRAFTRGVAFFLKPLQKGDPGYPDSQGKNGAASSRIAPAVRFAWGTFIFQGVMESMEERLDYFSADGKPLRATVTIEIMHQDILLQMGQPGKASAANQGQTPGTQAVTPARNGDSVQGMAGREGRSSDWKSIAAANGIDNPLHVPAGTLLNMNASAGASASAGAGFGASAGASAGFGASAGAGAGFGAGASAGAQAGFSAGLGAGAGFSAGASAGAGFGASAGASAGFNAGASAGAGFGASAGAGFGASASAGFGASAGASAGFGASAGAGFGTSAGASAGFGAGASAGGGFGAGASAGGGFGASAGAGFGAGGFGAASLGAGGSAGAGFGASAGGSAGFNAGASASAGASFGASAGAGVSAGAGASTSSRVYATLLEE